MHCINRVLLAILGWRGDDVGRGDFRGFCCFLVKHGPSLFCQPVESNILLLIPDAYLTFVNTSVKSHSVLHSFPYKGEGSMFLEQMEERMEVEAMEPHVSEAEVGKRG